MQSLRRPVTLGFYLIARWQKDNALHLLAVTKNGIPISTHSRRNIVRLIVLLDFWSVERMGLIFLRQNWILKQKWRFKCIGRDLRPSKLQKISLQPYLYSYTLCTKGLGNIQGKSGITCLHVIHDRNLAYPKLCWRIYNWSDVKLNYCIGFFPLMIHSYQEC